MTAQTAQPRAFWEQARRDAFRDVMYQRGRYEHASAGVSAGPKETAEYEFSPSEVCPGCFTVLPRTGVCGTCS